MTSLALLQRKVRRAVLGRRRLLAGVFAAVAVAASLRVVTGPPPPTSVVLTAARDLPSGATVQRSDLQESTFLPGSVPAGTLALAEIVGRTTAGPLRAGEPVTDVALVRASILDGYPGLVAVPVRVGDGGVVSLLRVGDRIDLLAADPQGLEAAVVASGVVVLALPRTDGDEAFSGTTSTSGRLVIVAVPESTAAEIAQAGVSSYISVVIRR